MFLLLLNVEKVNKTICIAGLLRCINFIHYITAISSIANRSEIIQYLMSD